LVQINKKLALLFSGDFPEGNTKNARLKAIASSLSDQYWDSTFISVMPARFSKNLSYSQPKQWHGFTIKFSSVSRKYPPFFILRLFQVAVGHLGMIAFILFRSKKYDLLYFYNPRWTDTLPSLILSSWLGRKTVVDQTELFSTGKNKKIHLSEERLVSKHATKVLAISNGIQMHFQLSRKDKVEFFPILVDFNRFDRTTTEQQFLMGYIGSFAAKDGVYMLLDAISLLIPQLPQIKLRLIGHNPKLQELVAEVASRGLADYVEVTGTVTFQDIPCLLQECDTLIMNRDSSAFASFGYPIKLGEYFACKKPVLMSNGGGFSDDFEDRNQVYKYTVDSAESLSNTLLYRYDNVEESDAVAKRGYLFAKNHFDSRTIGPLVAKIFREI
jgi:glycosyltransferase involved in cell wall biosynthesis